MTVNEALSSLNNAKQNNINSSNLLNASMVNTNGDVLLSNYIANNNGNINTINSSLLTKQAIINNFKKLNALFVSTTINNTSSNLDSVLNSNYASIQDLYAKTNSIGQIQGDIYDLQGLTSDLITNLDTVIQSNIPILNNNYQTLQTTKQKLI